MIYSIVTWLDYISLAMSISMLIVALCNLVYYHRTKSVDYKQFTLKQGPLVSVLIPARNEELNIENCLTSLANQSYDNYEILLLDDNSTDSTKSIAIKLSKKFNKIKIFDGKPLTKGWF